MGRMVVKIFPSLASYASLLGLTYTIWPISRPASWPQLTLFAIASVMLLFVIVHEIHDFVTCGPWFFTDQRKINDYMYEWISRGGRVAIFSRDLSWAGEQPIRDLLFEKASRDELCVCLPRKIPVAEALDRAGARSASIPNLTTYPNRDSLLSIVGAWGRVWQSAVPLARSTELTNSPRVNIRLSRSPTIWSRSWNA